MTPTKQSRVRRTGHAFVRDLRESGGVSARLRVRFDLACVTGTRLEVHEDAF